MSGGVGPCGDIHQTKEKEEEQGDHHLSSTKKTQHPNVHHHDHRFLTFQQLNALVVVVVFSASGMVAVEDLTFTMFSFFYVFFISRFAFPLLNPGPEPPLFDRKTLLSLYNAVGALIGLFLPIAYIFEGIYEGDKEGIKAAAPHVFLLASQMFMEGVVSSWRRFSVPMRAFVLVFFNTKRMTTISEWVRNEISKADEEFGSARRLHVGRGLALANMVFWFFNLFGFLLPCHVPRALKRYYGYKLKD